MHSSSLIRRLYHPELDDNTILPAGQVVAVQRVCSACWWRWLALVVVISWNSAIVTGRTPLSPSSVRRRTDVVDDVMIFAPTSDERPERLDSTITTTTTTITPPPPPPPPPTDDGTAVVPNEPPSAQHEEAFVVATTTSAPTESKSQQQQPPPPPPAINNNKNSSWDNNKYNNNTTMNNDDEEEEDDDDGLFQRPTGIYQKSPLMMLPFWWIAVGMGMMICSMIFTAWQMADYPDGLYAGLCRMILGLIQFLLSIVTLPLRKCCLCGTSWGHYNYRSGHHEPYGRISTMDYGYSNSNNSSSKNQCNDPVLEL